MASAMIQTAEDRSKQLTYSPERIVVVSPDKEPILLKSYLQKKGKRFRGWHHRYFEIQGTHMYYYKNASKTDCLGEIDLSLCVHCAPANEATFGAPFEIRTTLRTHVMSARSVEERAQWIEAIQTQVEAGSSELKDKEINGKDARPKRWKSFKNAFSINQRRHRRSSDRTLSAEIAATHKRRSLLDYLKRRNPLRSHSEMSHDPLPHSNRPMSMIDNTLTLDVMDVLLDSKPSHSLPASPLAKRSNALCFCTSNELALVDSVFVDPAMTLPATLTTLSVTDPSEDFIDPTTEDFVFISAPVPLSEASKAAEPASDSVKFTNAISGTGPTSVELLNVDKELTTNEQTTSEELVSIIVSEPVERSQVLDEAKCNVIKYPAWEAIREVLDKDSDKKWNNVVPLSYDVLPKQDQLWLNSSCGGMEGLRAFLEMLD